MLVLRRRLPMALVDFGGGAAGVLEKWHRLNSSVVACRIECSEHCFFFLFEKINNDGKSII